MNNSTLFLQGMSIVLLGDFNPKIFQPAWFVTQKLLGEKESDSADVQAITRDIVVYTMDWLRVQVTPERFQFSTEQEPYYEIMRDLLVGTFTKLEHTPIHSMGINMDYHYRMQTEKAWHEFGDKLTPKNHWEGILEKPGMLNVTMQGARSEHTLGLVRVSIAPSVRVNPGVHIGINDHYEVNAQKKILGCDEIMKVLNDAWASSLKKSKFMAQKLIGLV